MAAVWKYVYGPRERRRKWLAENPSQTEPVPPPVGKTASFSPITRPVARFEAVDRLLDRLGIGKRR